MGDITMAKTQLIALAFLAVLAIVYAQNRNLCTVAARKEQCPPSAPFFGFMGCAAALVFACLGAAYGTAKSGVGVANMGVLHPDVVMKSIIPVVMAGVLGIYGLIVALILQSNKLECTDVSDTYYITAAGTTNEAIGGDCIG